MQILVGEKIKEARERANLTQEELGRLIGVTGVTIMRYERNQRQPRLEQIEEIAKVLNVSVYSIVSGTTWKSVPEIYADDGYTFSENEIRLISAFSLLTDEAQEIAAQRVEELTEIPKYRK